MNAGARQANHDSDVYAAARKSQTQIELLKEIRDLLKIIANQPSVG